MTNFVETRNPRYDRSFSVTLHFENYVLIGQAFTPSAFGASVEISQLAYNYLQSNTVLWEKSREIKAVTSVNDLPAEINGFFSRDGKYFVSLKLLKNRSWYN